MSSLAVNGVRWMWCCFCNMIKKKIKFWFFKVLKIIVGEYFDSYSLMFPNSDVFAKTDLGRSWISVSYAFENYILITQFTVHIYSRFIFTQFSLENIGICKQKMVWFKVILRIWRKQSHTLWNKLVTYQKIDLPIFFMH